VIVRPGECVCDVVVEENDTWVEVLILICGEVENSNEVIDCPVHVYLARPLGNRRVLDAARDGATVQPFIPSWEGIGD
jgi:hypothetical protein